MKTLSIIEIANIAEYAVMKNISFNKALDVWLITCDDDFNKLLGIK